MEPLVTLKPRPIEDKEHWTYYPGFLDSKETKLTQLYKEVKPLVKNYGAARLSCKFSDLERKHEIEMSTKGVSGKFNYQKVPWLRGRNRL